ncbi:hypothetical protein ScPMuIL_002567 [Solemya velum]
MFTSVPVPRPALVQLAAIVVVVCSHTGRVQKQLESNNSLAEGYKMGLSPVILFVVGIMIGVLKVSSRTTANSKRRVTKNGIVEGFNEIVEQRDVSIFMGIPFAKPPVGNLRFRRPEPVGNWNDAIRAVQPPNACLQTWGASAERIPGLKIWLPTQERSEDCLYLNIWAPSLPVSGGLSTLVWIHGGSFEIGSSTMKIYDGKYLAAMNNVIVASMNYRLGPLGFLYAGNERAPGNMGLLDQSLALEWIYNNIEAFGGNRTKITLFGHSAGAASVGLHLLSPISKPFFSNAILQSGSPLMPSVYDYPEDSMSQTLRLAESIGCPLQDMDAVMGCLNSTDPLELVQVSMKKKSGLKAFFSPTTDSYFLTDSPSKLIHRRRMKNAKLLTGIVTNEMSLFLPSLYPGYFSSQGSTIKTRNDFLNAIEALVPMKNRFVLYGIVDEYELSVLASRRKDYSEIIEDLGGDYFFKCPMVELNWEYARMSTNAESVYVYSFEHRLSNNPWPEWMGVMHGYELELVFGAPFRNTSKYTVAERELSARMMRFWTNFAKTGNPNKETEFDQRYNQWPYYDNANEGYTILKTGSGHQTGAGLKHSECTFWTEMYPKLSKIGGTTANSTRRVTKNGIVEGFNEIVEQHDVSIFMGIPFAKPPVGNLRFRRPEAIGNWNEVIRAVQPPRACLQMLEASLEEIPGVKMWLPTQERSEDCLFLNIWAPSLPVSGGLSTLVWIHGGSFQIGSSTLNLYDGKYLAAVNNVIVASVNYRLGPLGFLYAGNKRAPGNMGLLDQALALEWIYNNIEAFGGNKTKITLSGQSAGAASVGLHLLSPISKPYFGNAILQSGSPLVQWAYASPDVSLNHTLQLAESIGCPLQDMDALMACLNSTDPLELLQFSRQKSSGLQPFCSPTTDNYFLTDSPSELIHRRQMKNAKLLTGIVTNEMSTYLPTLYPGYFSLQRSKMTKTDFLNAIEVLVPTKNKLVLDGIVEEYDLSVLASRRKDYSEIIEDIGSDYSFKCPLIELNWEYARMSTNMESTYVYSYEHRLSNNPWPEWMGVMHGYEIELVFGAPFRDTFNYTDAERELCTRIMKFWTNFAKTGNPNKETEFDQRYNQWPFYDNENEEYIILKTGSGYQTGTGLKHSECTFWTEPEIE